MNKEGLEMTRNSGVGACSLLLTVGLAMAVALWTSSAQALPIVQFSTSTIANEGCGGGAGTTAVDVSVDPNGFVLAAFVLEFGVAPSEINLVSVVGASGITASGSAGGAQFSFGATFSTNQTASFPVGTITVQGCVGGGQMLLAKQTYTDGDTFEDTVVTTAVVAATVAPGTGPTNTPTTAPATATPTTAVATATPTTAPATATPTTVSGTATPTRPPATVTPTTVSGTATATTAPATATPTIGPATATATARPPTTTPTTVPTTAPGQPTPTPEDDDDGCQISTAGGGSGWLLLIPAVALLVLRRRHR
jgi:MYXO-CTERM domain-containing protein